MFSGSIKISELNPLGLIVSNDFFPLVQSSSLTTFRVDINTLNNWFDVSGSAFSSSWASSSINATQAVSASWASSSLTSLQTISASWSSRSLNATQAVSASWASSSISSSFASVAISASFAPFTQSFQASGSWASQSLSSSYALSASFAPAIGDTVPIGTIVAFGGSTAPVNWLECNGAAQPTSSFSALYNAIQTTDPSASYGYLTDSFGNRNASGSYFKIPDFRGEFLRGWDHSRGIDIGRVNTSFQPMSLQSHKHFDPYGENGAGIFGDNGGTGFKGSATTDTDNPLLFTNDGTSYLGVNPNPPGVVSNETRPRNVAILYCIKYSNNLNFATTGISLAGDVVGTSSATTVQAIQHIPVTSSAPQDGQILTYSSASNVWYPASQAATSLTKNGISYIIPNPGALFGNGTDLYVFNFNRYNAQRNLVKIDTKTNLATYLVQWPQAAWDLYGRIFRSTSDGQLHILTFSNVDLYDYNIGTNILTRITGSGGYYQDLPVKVSWASGSLIPTVWAFYGSINAGTNGTTPTFKWRKHWFDGAAWHADFVSTALDIRTINGNASLLNFINYSTNPNTVAGTILWDYNVIKQRYYLMDNGTGYLHIFQQNTGDIDTNWGSTYVNYVKTLALPISPLGMWSDVDTEKMTIDYNPDTGQERGVCHLRRDNQNVAGNVAYIYWPE